MCMFTPLQKGIQQILLFKHTAPMLVCQFYIDWHIHDFIPCCFKVKNFLNIQKMKKRTQNEDPLIFEYFNRIKTRKEQYLDKRDKRKDRGERKREGNMKKGIFYSRKYTFPFVVQTNGTIHCSGRLFQHPQMSSLSYHLLILKWQNITSMNILEHFMVPFQVSYGTVHSLQPTVLAPTRVSHQRVLILLFYE